MSQKRKYAYLFEDHLPRKKRKPNTRAQEQFRLREEDIGKRIQVVQKDMNEMTSLMNECIQRKLLIPAELSYFWVHPDSEPPILGFIKLRIVRYTTTEWKAKSFRQLVHPETKEMPKKSKYAGAKITGIPTSVTVTSDTNLNRPNNTEGNFESHRWGFVLRWGRLVGKMYDDVTTARIMVPDLRLALEFDSIAALFDDSSEFRGFSNIPGVIGRLILQYLTILWKPA